MRHLRETRSSIHANAGWLRLLLRVPPTEAETGPPGEEEMRYIPQSRVSKVLWHILLFLIGMAIGQLIIRLVLNPS